YTRHGRGSKGMIAIHTGERNGNLVGAVLVEEKDEVMLVSTGGVVIRTKVAQIREQGRSTQGVTLINLDAGTRLAGIEKVLESDDDAGGANGGDTDGNGEGNDITEGE
ncbi:MAG TPA: DNA gyrase C-terminal beta-propeller domain-containing protein, partial [Burkholderiales bacterium]